jgi:hypothetical protein
MITKLLKFFGLDALVAWFRPSFEGDDGKSSARRLTSFLIVILYIIGHIRFFKEIVDPYWLIRLILVDAMFICVLFSIINLQQLLTVFIKVKNGVGGALDNKDGSTEDEAVPAQPGS